MTDQCQSETTCCSTTHHHPPKGKFHAGTKAHSGEGGECCCNMPEKLLGLADEAWFELLKEKIKAEITKSCGADLDKLAKLIAETNDAKWKHIIQGKVQCQEYRDKLMTMFSESCKT